ncbi:MULTISPECIES: flagellar hook-associated protein FlgL [unclassified Duganella]|uniref:flagellar hook-associated protein FlgL n=1 Tax=unclassified Duganella TaxID=2636909 RepID=UPI0006FC395C|nr:MULTISPECIES: flagellar hook-associated protein FlgL [unclassified Duganella]KQV61722.1 flagellar biosynthesis protein FlgL [Duganella sp. Root336D2]KRB84229.1 flagellar biosynthesis protein FlgL [Duganella sp. Root198D2]
MRIASSQFQASMNRSLQINQSVISKLTEQMATGNKIQVPSDEPIANVRLSRLRREENIVSQYVDNISAVKIRLSKNETYLGSMVDDMGAARDLFVWASDGSNTPADLNSMVNSLVALRDSLYFNGNTKDQEGKFIFSGTLTSTAALSYDATQPLGARYSYTGNNGTQEVVVGNGITQPANVTVQGIDTYLNQLDQAISMLGSPTVSASDPALQAVLKTALDGTDTALNQVSSKIAQFGGAQNVMETLANNHGNVSLSNKIAITDIAQLDYGLAATQLSGYNSALQATYQAYSKVSGLSLFNVL